MIARLVTMLVVGLFVLCTSACTCDNVVIGPHDPTPLPTASSTMSELIASLSDPDYHVRLASIYALRDMGSAAEPAVSALIIVLSDDVSDVRTAAAYAFGAIGPAGASAVPALVQVLRSDKYGPARVAAAESLGRIGDTSAVPILAEVLWDQGAHMSLRIEVSQATAWLTGAEFPDCEPGPHAYKLNDEGEPLIVIAAREWWMSEGQYQEWPVVADE